MKSDCQKIRDHISDLISGTLAESDKQALREHLSTCNDCHKYAQTLEQEDVSLTDHFAQIDADMATHQGRVLRAIEGMPRSRRDGVLLIGRKILRSPITRIAAVIAIIAIAALLIDHNIPRDPAHTATEHETEAGSRTISTIELATAISLEKAFKQGGIEAVENQYRKAFGTTRRDTDSPSIEELLTDLETEMNHHRSKNI